jgi:uncharacterized protein YbjT (DUF2867 family)
MMVRALIRDQDKVESLRKLAVDVMVGSVLNEAALQEACSGVRTIISALGTRTLADLAAIEAIEHEAIVKLMGEAKAADVEHIVLCSSMGTTTPERLPTLAEVLRAKRRGELALEESGLPYTIVRPGGLTDEPGGSGVLIHRSIQTPGRISRTDVAEVLAQAVLQPAAWNQTVEIINQAGQRPANRPDLFHDVAG